MIRLDGNRFSTAASAPALHAQIGQGLSPIFKTNELGLGLILGRDHGFERRGDVFAAVMRRAGSLPAEDLAMAWERDTRC